MTTYRQALQRESDKRYDFTSSTGSTQAHAVGYCAGWREPAAGEEATRLEKQFGPGFVQSLNLELEAKRQHQAKYHTDGHATAAEACACFHQYELDNELEFKTKPVDEATELHRCQAASCKEFTAGIAFLGQHRHFYLCDMHRNRDEVEKLVTKKDPP